MTSESMVDAIQDRKKNAFKNIHNYKMGMGQILLLPYLGVIKSIHQLF
jgi:hypothetical protein